MHIEVIRNANQWVALAGDWNKLLNESHNNVPFLTFEFQRAWWEHLGGREWTQSDLNIVIGRGPRGQLLGIAPLFATADKHGKKTLQFIGSHEIADYLDLIVRPADHTAFVEALLDYLAAEGARAELYNMLDSSRTIRVLEEIARRRGGPFHLDTLQPSPYIPIPLNFESYVDSLNSKQAHELRRKLRRAARNPSPVTMEIVRKLDELDQALNDFFWLMSQESDKAKFLTLAMRTQMAAIARAAFTSGWLQLAFLKCGNTRIAGYMNFDYDNRVWAYNAGFHNGYSNLSPGWVIVSEMVKWCIQNGREAFDFMRGGEEYKYRFGGKDRFVLKAVIGD